MKKALKLKKNKVNYNLKATLTLAKERTKNY
jgi:hypothetical protein